MQKLNRRFYIAKLFIDHYTMTGNEEVAEELTVDRTVMVTVYPTELEEIILNVSQNRGE